MDWLNSMPWGKTTPKLIENIKVISEIFDDDLVGMKNIKKKILEVIECQQHKEGKILYFYGPPGVGKTLMAESIARALGRQVSYCC